MARIRSIKPEFWEDDVVASISRDARLLFIATFNLADDEGLLRWTPPYIKSQAFMYDDDVDVDRTAALMAELVEAGFVFPYIGGRAQQRLAFVVNFRRHQKINRPQPSKLPAPSLQNPQVRQMYGRRDGWECAICGRQIANEWNTHGESRISVDHIVPRFEGGSDYPSNIQATHLVCNKRRGVTPQDVNEELSDSCADEIPNVQNEPSLPVPESLTLAPPEPVSDSLRDSLTDAVSAAATNSPPEGKGREGRGGGTRVRTSRSEPPQRIDPEPPPRCPRHIDDPSSPPCGACADARRSHQTWERRQRNRPTPTPTRPRCPLHPEHETGSRDCPACTQQAAPAPNLRALRGGR